MSNFFDVAHAHSKPSNKNAAMAVSGGLNYSPSEKEHQDFDAPPAYWLLRDLPERFATQQQIMHTCAAMYGLKSFRLTVLGLAKDEKRANGARYVCKCSCGMFCLRSAKQLRAVKYQSCGVCKQNQSRIIQEYHRKTGVYLDDVVVWQRMGGA